MLKNKKFAATYFIWIIIHTFFLLQGNEKYYASNFWPIGDSMLRCYDMSEWVLYVFTPGAVLFFVNAFFDKNSTKSVLALLFISGSASAQIGGDYIPLVPNQSTISTNYTSSSPSSLKEELDALSRDYPIPVRPEYRYSTQEERDNWSATFAEYNRDFQRRWDAIIAKYRSSDSAKKVSEQHEAFASGIDENTNVHESATNNNSQSSFNSYVDEPTLQAKMAPTSFDWDKSNADRFVNSPCFGLLGFDPYADPQEQERKYKECEHEKDMATLKKASIIAIVVIGFVMIIALGLNKK
jgi:hypothetical protein